MTAKDLIERLNEDEYLREAFRANPLALADRCQMTIGEVLNIGAEWSGLRKKSVRDLEALSKLLAFVAEYPNKTKQGK
jgi:hypothetical protein